MKKALQNEEYGSYTIFVLVRELITSWSDFEKSLNRTRAPTCITSVVHVITAKR